VKKPPLQVLAGRAPAGVLARSDVEQASYLFGYRPGTTAADAVSLTMPVRVDQYDSMGGLLPIFEMNLPEGPLRERLSLQFAKAIPEFDDLDLLQIVGSSQIGRLRYSSKDTLDDEVPAQDLAEILTYEGSADLFAHLLERFAQYSGISGMQPKVLVREGTQPGKLTHRGTTHIVKSFDPGQFPELAANELICTRGAAAAGIHVPRMQLSMCHPAGCRMRSSSSPSRWPTAARSATAVHTARTSASSIATRRTKCGWRPPAASSPPFPTFPATRWPSSSAARRLSPIAPGC